MADIDDRWHRKGANGPERTDRYGQGRRWMVRYRDPAGDQRAKSFERKKDAEAYAASVATDMRSGSYVDPTAGRMTVGDWADQYLGTLGHLTQSSRARTVSVVERHIRPRWGTTSLSSVSHAAVLRWVSDLTSTLSPRSVRKVHGTLRQLLTLAVRDGRLSRNPADNVRLPQPGVTEHRYLDHAEVAMLAKECGEYGLSNSQDLWMVIV